MNPAKLHKALIAAEPPDYSSRLFAVFAAIAIILTLVHFFGKIEGFDDIFIGHGGHPYHELLQYLYFNFFAFAAFCLLPVIFGLAVLESPYWGLSLRGLGKHWLMYLVLFGLMVPVVYVSSRTDTFFETYPLYAGACKSIDRFLIWEGTYALQFFAVEFFFRGVFLFYLSRFFGLYAIGIMLAPYAALHFSKPFVEAIGSIIAGTVLGYLSLYTRSIWGGVLLHIGVAWSMDLMALYRKFPCD